jgi:hypothetical protein
VGWSFLAHCDNGNSGGVTEQSEIAGMMGQRAIGDSMRESDLEAASVRGHVVASLARASLSARTTSQEALATQSRGEQVSVMFDEVILWMSSPLRAWPF